MSLWIGLQLKVNKKSIIRTSNSPNKYIFLIILKFSLIWGNFSNLDNIDKNCNFYHIDSFIVLTYFVL